MGTQLRDKDPATIHLITVRTEGARYLLRPSNDVNEIIGGVFARYQEIFSIELFAYTVMSNHQHLLARAPKGNLDEFMENVNRELARRMNYKWRRRGRFWSRRYRAQSVPTDMDLEEAFLYVVTNPVKHGAVRHPTLWKGLNSYQQSLSERAKTYSFFRYSERNPDKRETFHELTITPLPTLKHLPPEQRRQALSEMVEARTAQLVEERTSSGKGFSNPDAATKADPFFVPPHVTYTPTGSCYSKDPAVIKTHRQAEKMRLAAYAFASLRFRLGQMDVEFPAHTFKPPLHRKPRFEHFSPLSEEFLSQKTFEQ